MATSAGDEFISDLQTLDCVLSQLGLSRSLRSAFSTLIAADWHNLYGDDLEDAAAAISRTRYRSSNVQRNRVYGEETMGQLSDHHFRRMFRLSRTAFNALLEKIQDDLQVHGKNAENGSGSPISPCTRLAVALRWLAGGSYIDICFEFGIGLGSFYQDGGVLWGTLEVLDQALELGFPFDDDAELDRLADGFASFSRGNLTGCTMAIDGWVCRTRKPRSNEVMEPMAYRNRHDCWGLVVLAGCDADLRFLMFSNISTGSTNDVLAWDFCEMKHLLDSGELRQQSYRIGDEAFINSQQLLVPWSGRGLEVWKDSFNYHLSAMRQCIERAFGLLVERWGIFWRPLRCAYSRWTLVCAVAAKLHNYAIDMNEGRSSDILQRTDEDWEENDEPLVYLNGNGEAAEENVEEGRVRPIGDRRRQITDYLKAQGVRRPVHASTNSRV
eukprot:gb/GECG01009509.1/.p1 GENE.gb/GECG01009509.1/~~gb/GECG01009509.1/.p1  ORF type:complete len:440 (+),score=36.00 gb/GECG01009509.1/:1-1320(+)